MNIFKAVKLFLNETKKNSFSQIKTKYKTAKMLSFLTPFESDLSHDVGFCQNLNICLAAQQWANSLLAEAEKQPYFFTVFMNDSCFLFFLDL
jgi:hypothetical protein